MKNNILKENMIYAAMCVLIAMLCIVAAPSDVGAAPKKISNDCAKAYAKKVNQWHKKYHRDNCPELEAVIIYDLNGDRTPELLYNMNLGTSAPGYYEIYTYRRKKVVKIGSCPGGDGIFKVPGSKTKYRFATWFGSGSQGFGQITVTKNKVKYTVYGYCDGWPTQYYINNKRVSEKKYRKEEKKYKRKMNASTELKPTRSTKKAWTAKKIKSIAQ